jgi:hypothetical protein
LYASADDDSSRKAHADGPGIISRARSPTGLAELVRLQNDGLSMTGSS